MNQKNIPFSYKAGTSFFHKMPSFIKILFIPLFNILIFSFDWRVALCFIGIQAILFFCLKFSVSEQLADLKPVLYYAVLMYTVDIASAVFIFFQQNLHDFTVLLDLIKKALLNEGTFNFVVKFFACSQSAALMFKTSTQLEIRNGIETIELKIRSVLPCKKNARFANVISLFINFIPAVFKLWNELSRAWFARGGKKSLKMYMTLFPSLFFLGLKYTENAVKALEIRNFD